MPRALEPDVARLYHVHSSNSRHRTVDLAVDEDRRPRRFRTYPGSERWELPGRDFELAAPLGDVLQRRSSVRQFQLRPLELTRLGRLLHASFGVSGQRQIEGQWTCCRPTPSAGGLYPLEVYVATQAVDGLPDGIYHYDARAHQLERRRSGSVHADLARMTIGQEMLREANLVVLIAAIFPRTMWKYGQRGYRYVWLDAGHLGQNLYLVATALGMGPVAIGGFFDGEINRLVELPKEEEVIYLVGIGQPIEGSSS